MVILRGWSIERHPPNRKDRRGAWHNTMLRSGLFGAGALLYAFEYADEQGPGIPQTEIKRAAFSRC